MQSFRLSIDELYQDWKNARGRCPPKDGQDADQVSKRRNETIRRTRQYLDIQFFRYRPTEKQDTLSDEQIYFLLASLAPFVRRDMDFHYAFPVHTRSPIEQATDKIASTMSIGMKGRALLPEERCIFSDLAARSLLTSHAQDFMLDAACRNTGPAPTAVCHDSLADELQIIVNKLRPSRSSPSPPERATPMKPWKASLRSPSSPFSALPYSGIPGRATPRLPSRSASSSHSPASPPPPAARSSKPSSIPPTKSTQLVA